MSVKLNSSGGGSVTLQEPVTASNFTLTLPAQTANVITDSSAILNIGSGQVYKDASGNVGIGTSSPLAKLNVVTSGNKSTIAIGDTAVSTYSQLLMYGGSGKYNWSVGAQYNVNNAFEITPSTATGGTTFSTPAFVIDSSGNVGVGLASPDSRLHVKGAGATFGQLRIGYNGTSDNYYDGDNQYFRSGSGNSNYGKFDSSGNFQFNSGYGSVATAYGCRAWLNYDANAQSIRGSANVSSVTYNSTGYYTVNFSSSMPDANYSVVAMGEWTSGTTSQTLPSVRASTPPAASNCPLVNQAGGFRNGAYFLVAFFR